MLNRILNIRGVRLLSNLQLKELNGGKTKNCSGTGSGGHFEEGCSQACVGRPQNYACTINGFSALCTGNGCGFWFT